MGVGICGDAVRIVTARFGAKHRRQRCRRRRVMYDKLRVRAYVVERMPTADAYYCVLCGEYIVCMYME